MMARPGTGLLSLLVCAALMLIGCSTAAELHTNIAWPNEVIAALDNSDETYAWQRCSGSLDNSGLTVASAAGVYDPISDSGMRVTKQLRSDGQDLFTQYSLTTGTVQSESAGTWFDTPSAEGFSLQLLRDPTTIKGLFDLNTVVEDIIDPENSKPIVQQIVAPAEVGIALRLEGLPDGWPLRWAESDPGDYAAVATLAPQNANYSYSYGTSVMWLVDVWADDVDVERVRFQTQDEVPERSSPTYSEVRFVSVDEVLRDDAIVLPRCPPEPGDSNDAWHGFEPWRPTRTVPLKVSLDENGRPYDVDLYQPVSVRREVVAELAIPGGRLVVMDGSGIEVDPSFFGEGAKSFMVAPDRVSDDGVHYVNLEIIWERPTLKPDQQEAVLGVWVGPSDAEVAAWDAFEHAYGTDGGLGGIIPATVIKQAEQLSDDEFWVEEEDFDALYRLHDLDGVPGLETFTFSNGFGDGGFPMSKGRNASGEVVAVVIWRTDVPWRMAVPIGTPPADVTVREEQLLECLSGARPVRADGQCDFDQ